MADNVAITAGSGTSIATDQVTGTLEHVQLMKVAYSADGSRTLVTADADGILVNLGTNNDVAVSSIAAGDNNIGNVDVVTLPAIPAGTNNIGDVDVLTVNGVAPAFGSGVRGATVQRVTIATDDVVPVTDNGGALTVDNAGTFAVQVDGSALTALQLIDDPVFADDAAFTIATSKVNAVGGYAVAHGSNPDAADAGDAGILLMNRHRVQFVIGGHPNTQVVTARRAAADTGVTDGAIISVSAGTKIVVTRLTVTASNANTVNVAVKVGFGTATLTADSTTGAANVIADHEGVPPGGGFTIGDGSGIIAVGADDADLRWTCDTPTGGHIIISVSYFTIES